MKMEQMENGCLKIWLDEPDMREMGLRFEDMDYRTAATREAITRLLETAREETGFEAPDGLLVEVLPLDKGCLILMTPSRTAPASVSSERRKFRMVRAGGPFVYAVDNVDQLFQLCAGLRRFRRSGGDAWFREPASSLYRCLLYTSDAADERDAVGVRQAGRRRGCRRGLHRGTRPAPGHRRRRGSTGPLLIKTRSAAPAQRMDPGDKRCRIRGRK